MDLSTSVGPVLTFRVTERPLPSVPRRNLSPSCASSASPRSIVPVMSIAMPCGVITMPPLTATVRKRLRAVAELEGHVEREPDLLGGRVLLEGEGAAQLLTGHPRTTFRPLTFRPTGISTRIVALPTVTGAVLVLIRSAKVPRERDVGDVEGHVDGHLAGDATAVGGISEHAVAVADHDDRLADGTELETDVGEGERRWSPRGVGVGRLLDAEVGGEALAGDVDRDAGGRRSSGRGRPGSRGSRVRPPMTNSSSTPPGAG